MTSERMSSVWLGGSFASKDARFGQVLITPRFSVTNTRPPGAKRIEVGAIRPVTTVSSTKPAGRPAVVTDAAVPTASFGAAPTAAGHRNNAGRSDAIETRV